MLRFVAGSIQEPWQNLSPLPLITTSPMSVPPDLLCGRGPLLRMVTLPFDMVGAHRIGFALCCIEVVYERPKYPVVYPDPTTSKHNTSGFHAHVVGFPL